MRIVRRELEPRRVCCQPPAASDGLRSRTARTPRPRVWVRARVCACAVQRFTRNVQRADFGRESGIAKHEAARAFARE